MATQRGIIAGKAYVILEAVDNTPRVLSRIQANFMRFATQLQTMGATMITRGIAAATPSVISTKIFSDFDDAMRRVEARSSGTADQLAEVREQARLLGRTTAFTARMIANLQSILAQRGFSRTKILEMTPNVMSLARAAGSGNRGQDILTSADLVSGALRAFKIEAKDSSKVADLFTIAVNDSNFSLEDLIISMGNVGPIAAQYKSGVGGLADTLAALAAMRNVNIDPSIAGTGLRNLFLKASDRKRRADFNAFLKEMTGNTIEFIDAAGNLNHIPSILNSIDEAMQGLGTAERGDLLADLFGLRAIVPAAALSKAIRTVNEMIDKFKTSGGLAIKTAAKMDAGIGGSFRILISAAEGLAISLGDVLAPAIMTINDLATKIQAGTSQWIREHKNLVAAINIGIVTFIAMGATLFLIGTAIKMITFSMSPLILTFKLLMVSLKLTTGLILALFAGMVAMGPGGVLAAVAAVSVALLVFPEILGIIGQMAKDVFDTVKEKVLDLLGTLKMMGEGIAGALRAGQLELATKIALESVKLLWIQFKNDILLLWQGMLNKMIKGLYATVKLMQSIVPYSSQISPLGKAPQQFGQLARGKLEERAQQEIIKGLMKQIDPSRDIIEDLKRRAAGPLEGLRTIPEVFRTNQNLVRAGIKVGGNYAVPQKGLEEKTGDAIIQFYKNLAREQDNTINLEKRQLDALEEIAKNTEDIGSFTIGTSIIGI